MVKYCRTGLKFRFPRKANQESIVASDGNLKSKENSSDVITKHHKTSFDDSSYEKNADNIEIVQSSVELDQ